MILEVSEIHAYYGLAHVLHGVSLRVDQGEVVALLGRNGAGKSTTLKAIMGIVPPRSGRVIFKGTDITGWPPHRVARLGIGYVPETRDIFSYLTTQENLLIAYNRRSRWTPETITDLFPKLAELRDRRGRNLSGGEQQMVAIARALLTGPDLLLLDEPSQGLAPIIVESILDAVKRLKAQGLSMLLVEQNFDLAVELADRVYLIDHGQIVFEGSTPDLLARPEVTARYLGVTV
jgi:branched-chain amino acid transport system ATP-binding protein